jgi:regulator of sigma E protease
MLQRSVANGAESPQEVVLALQDLSAKDLESELFKQLGLELAQPKPLLGEILPGGPAAQAGLEPGDLILKVDGVAVGDAAAFISSLQAAPGRSVVIDGLRQGKEFSVRVTPQVERVADRIIGRIQAQVDLSAATVVVQSAPLEAVAQATRKTWETCALTVKMLGKMLTGDASLKNITGPITIADYAGQSARVGWISFLSFMAFISISLGVMNLLPIPVLDGGHLLYYALELFSGRPVPERIGMFAQRAGLGVLMALMAVAVFNDIIRLIG